MEFLFIQDDGHGWLAVSHETLARFGFTASDFTAYSFRDTANAYLEEDCDASRFLAKVQGAGLTPYFRTRTVRRAAVRDKARCRPFGH